MNLTVPSISVVFKFKNLQNCVCQAKLWPVAELQVPVCLIKKNTCEKMSYVLKMVPYSLEALDQVFFPVYDIYRNLS